MRVDYSIYYKDELSINLEADWAKEYDLFVSSFNKSQRVNFVFERVKSQNKKWIIFPEYGFSEEDLINCDSKVLCEVGSEPFQIKSFFESLGSEVSSFQNIAIDITGFLRPQLAILMYFLRSKSVKKFDLFYSEPKQYKMKEETTFSDGDTKVKQISGFEGDHVTSTSNDVLLIGSGYDYQLIKSVCNDKAHASKLQLIGFPSLRPDMYQENLLKASRASEEIGDFAFKRPIHAPANDPFQTAQALSDEICRISLQKKITNLYLSPLSTKPQTIGFILYYLTELEGEAASIIFPFSTKYSQETSDGINKIWRYTIEY